MGLTICSVDGCESSVRRNGLCASHSMRLFRYGDPTHVPTRPTPEERFWSRVDRSGSCWQWIGSFNGSGYGVININGRTVRAHRYSWSLVNGQMAPGQLLDHACRNRGCVNPSHLRLATNKQNSENQDTRPGSLSKYRGVSFNRRRGKWVVQVGHGGRNYYGGYYLSEDEAGIAARELRNRLYTHNDLDRKEAA